MFINYEYEEPDHNTCDTCRMTYHDSDSNNHGEGICYFCASCNSSILFLNKDNHGEGLCIATQEKITEFRQIIEQLSNLDLYMNDQEIHSKTYRDKFGETAFNIQEDQRKLYLQMTTYNEENNLCPLCHHYFDNFSFEKHGYDICKSHPEKIEQFNIKINEFSKINFDAYHLLIHEEINNRYSNALNLHMQYRNSVISDTRHKKAMKKKWEHNRKRYTLDDLIENKIIDQMTDEINMCVICFSESAKFKFSQCDCKINTFCTDCITDYMKGRECPSNYCTDQKDNVKCPTCNHTIDLC